LRSLARNAGEEQAELAEENVEEILELVFERYWQSSALLGTQESCRKVIEKLASIGVTEVACLIDFGIESNKVLEHLRYLDEFKKMFVSRDTKRLLEREAVSALQITPAYLQVLLEDEGAQHFIKGLRHILIGGERLGAEVKERLRALSGAKLYNVYGPTETTIWPTAGMLERGKEVGIGRPIGNTDTYIVDGDGNLCGMGIPGELWIGGAAVARGYWGQAELTAEKFVANPFGEGRLYRTGDVGRWLADGNIEHLGRREEQVKKGSWTVRRCHV
jgi:acyl-CoA synthetase (AMP-forming)/AMP-acid ligase II